METDHFFCGVLGQHIRTDSQHTLSISFLVALFNACTVVVCTEVLGLNDGPAKAVAATLVGACGLHLVVDCG